MIINLHLFSSSSVLCQATLDRLCPYKGWALYFTEGRRLSTMMMMMMMMRLFCVFVTEVSVWCSGFIESSPIVEKIKVFEKYFTSKIELYDKVSEPVGEYLLLLATYRHDSSSFSLLCVCVCVCVSVRVLRMRSSGRAVFWWITPT